MKKNVIKVCFLGCDWWEVIICLDNGLALNRRGAIIQLIEAEWRIYASLNRAIIGSDNGLSPVRRQAIIWTNAGILLIEPLGTNFSEVLIGIQTFSFKKLYLKTWSAKWRLFCLGLNELNQWWSSSMMNI